MATQVTNLELLDKIRAAQANPSLILQTAIDLQEQASSGQVNYVDPSNPAVAQMETSAVIHAASVQQNMFSLRALYPNLAQTPEDLYNHMSYRDYINRFASPSTDIFNFFVSFNQFMNRAVRVPGTDYSMITIPRDTRVTVNKYVTFTFQYPINIKYFDSQSLEVSYDNDIESPLQSLKTNIIVSDLVSDPNSNDKWIRFSIPLLQVKINKVSGNVQPGAYFVMNVDFTDQYCLTRAWWRSSSTDGWKEMLTTHSPSVYDPSRPTMQLKVIDNTLNASLPLIYQNQGLVIGEIRLDVYTSKGAEIIDLAEYPLTEYIIDMESLDPNRDSTVYTAAAANVTVRCRSLSLMSSGKNALTFDELKERVIYSSLGEPEIPITNITFKNSADNRGFDLVPDVDVVTNRIFLATRSLPAPSDKNLVTSANIGMSTYVTTDPTLIDHPWVKVHGKRTTFLSKNLYQSNNGILRLLSKQEVDNINALPVTSKLNTINSGNYLYSPFYYVLDTSSLEFQVRPYQLDQPVASNLDFREQNTTIQLVVNTSEFNLRKVDTGYKLRIVTNSGDSYKNLGDAEVNAQLGIRLKNSQRYAYWLGALVGKTATNERIYEFDIQTEYDINEDNELIVTNGLIDATSSTPVEIALDAKFSIFHTTSSITSVYKPSEIDSLIGKFMLPDPSVGITYETLDLEFGKSLDGLWSRGRTLPDSNIYKRYNQDVLDIAEEDVYAEPPFTIENGQVVYHYLYRAGEVKKDANGDPIILHHKGDVIIVNGEPVIDKQEIGSREFDILMIDGRHYFVDDQAYLAYNLEFVRTLVDWITEDIPLIQAKALEKTKVFFYPKNQLARTTLVTGDYIQETVESEQPVEIDAWVKDSLLRDATRRAEVTTQTVRYLANWISKPRVAVSDAITALADIYGASSDAIKVHGLAQPKDIQLVIIAFDEQRLSLRRILDVQQDGTYIIREDVTINLYKADPVVLPR